jgi:hypothetical protein
MDHVSLYSLEKFIETATACGKHRHGVLKNISRQSATFWRDLTLDT